MTEYEQRLVDKTIDVCASSYLHRDDPNYLELEEKCISETQIQETKFDIVDLLNSNSTKSVLLAVIGFLFLIILWIYIRDIKD
jgi:hypothetical protein